MKDFSSSWLWGDKLKDRVIRWILMVVFIGIVCFISSISLFNNYEDVKSDNHQDTKYNIKFLESLLGKHK